MVTQSGRAVLGMDHFGPERSMYEATLRHTGMHRQTDDAWRFASPSDGDTWGPAWAIAETMIRGCTDAGVSFDVLYSALASPPVGLKNGPIPVLITAMLLANRDEIAVYQDGTYQPELTEDLLERLVKTPDRFSAKAITVSGLRYAIVEQLGVALGAVLPPRGVGIQRSYGLSHRSCRWCETSPTTAGERTIFPRRRWPCELP